MLETILAWYHEPLFWIFAVSTTLLAALTFMVFAVPLTIAAQLLFRPSLLSEV